MIKVIDRTDEFIIIEASEEGMPSKRTSIHIDSIINGNTTLEEQMAICEADCKLRMQRLKAMNKALGIKGTPWE